MDYITINIRVHDDNGSYIVAANSPRSRKPASCVFHMPPERWQDLEPSLRVLKARSGELVQHDHIHEIREFGTVLFNNLIHNEVRTLYDNKKQEAFQSSKILLLRLTLLPIELVMLPWELLYDDRSSSYLCLEQQPKITIIRHPDHSLSQRRNFSTDTFPLQILGVTAEPVTLDFLDVEKEKHLIEEALKELTKQQQVMLEWKPGKYSELEEIKLGVKRYDIFHFTGHGRVHEPSQQGQLAFEGEKRFPRYVSAEHLRMFLHSTTKLIVLNACETASGNRFNYFSNIAYSLIKAGFPAVIAMQFTISNPAALKFSRTFYTLLARGVVVEEAVMEARQAIYLASEETNPLDWAAPILYVSSSIPLSFLPGDKNRVENTEKQQFSLPPVEHNEKKDLSTVPLPDTSPPGRDGISNTPLPSLDVAGKPLSKSSLSLPLQRRIGLFILIFLIVLGAGGGSFAAYKALSSTMSPSGCNVPGEGSTALFIGTEFPSSEKGASAAKFGADLAIKEHHNIAPGYTLNTCDKDDASGEPPHHNPDLGAQNMSLFANDPRVLGVVGPENSNVALKQIPIAISAGLALISPSTTNPCLTLPQYCSNQGLDANEIHPPGKANAFFRLPGNDLQQGEADAKLAARLHIDTVCIVDDNEVYGQGLADAFSENFSGIVRGTRFHIQAGESPAQLAATAAQVVAYHSQAVFYGGSVSNLAAPFKRGLDVKGFSGTFLGGDGIGSDETFPGDAGPYADNTYATSLGPDPLHSSLPPSFRNDYENSYGQLTSRSLLGYDAAMILIQAIQKAIMTHTQNLRNGVLTNVQNTSYQGLTGNISFDSNGDNSGPLIFSVYTAKQGAWIYVTEIKVQEE